MDKIRESQKAALDRFLADNPELEELSDRLATFNIFRTLRIEKAEIRHSNVLAWLLSPEESHGLGDIVLRRVLSNILLQADTNIQGVSAARVELMDFADIEIRREWRNIDLFVIDRTNKLLLLIENKIYSGESPGQLLRYQKAVSEEFPSFTLMPVFLTLTGEEAIDSKASFVCYSYLQLLAVLEKIFIQRQSQLSEQVSIFIRQYIDVLRRLTMEDESLVELCKTIYRRHREAIDLIVEYGMAGVGQQIVEDMLSKDEGEYEVLRSRPTSVWFLPKSWSEIIPENSTAPEFANLKRPVSVICWIEFYKQKAYIHFELSAMDPPEIRITCLEKLQEAGFKVAKWAFDPDRKYSRFFGKSLKISDMTDHEEVHEVVDRLLKSAKTEFPKAEAVFREVFKDINIRK